MLLTCVCARMADKETIVAHAHQWQFNLLHRHVKCRGDKICQY